MFANSKKIEIESFYIKKITSPTQTFLLSDTEKATISEGKYSVTTAYKLAIKLCRVSNSRDYTDSNIDGQFCF